MDERKTSLASTVQVVSVVIGVVISIWSFNAAREKEAEARSLEADRPYVELRRKTYLEAVKTAAIIANPEGRSPEDLSKAKRRFRELYVAELTMVEDPGVATDMINLAKAVDPEVANLSPAQSAALHLAIALKPGYMSPHANYAPDPPTR